MKTIHTFLSISALTLFVGWARAETPVQTWAQRYSNSIESNDKAKKIVTDSSGNVIVAGYTASGTNVQEMLIIKYSGTGSALWTNRYMGPANTNDAPIALAVDKSGNVFVAGCSAGSGGYNDYVTIAYSGAEIGLWTNRYDGPIHFPDQPNAVAVDDSGNVIVTGYSYGGRYAPDYATIKYSGAGLALWTNRFSSIYSLFAKACAVAADTNGNVFVTGYA